LFQPVFRRSRLRKRVQAPEEVGKRDFKPAQQRWGEKVADAVEIPGRRWKKPASRRKTVIALRKPSISCQVNIGSF